MIYLSGRLTVDSPEEVSNQLISLASRERLHPGRPREDPHLDDEVSNQLISLASRE